MSGIHGQNSAKGGSLSARGYKHHIPVGSMGTVPHSEEPMSAGEVTTRLPQVNNTSQSARGVTGSSYSQPRPPPQLCNPQLHLYRSHNHEYYAKDVNFYGTYSAPDDRGPRWRAQMAKLRAELERGGKGVSAGTTLPDGAKGGSSHQTAVPLPFSITPRGISQIAAFSANLSLDDPDGCTDAVLEEEYLRSRKEVAYSCDGLTTVSGYCGSSNAFYPMNEACAAAARKDQFALAMQHSLDRQLAEGLRQLTTDEAPHPTDTAAELTHSGSSSASALLQQPTAYELRRLFSQHAPPIRSVKAVADRIRHTETVLKSTKRIIPQLPEGRSESLRRTEQRKRTAGLSEVEKWKIKMGLLDPVDVGSAYGGVVK